MPPYLDCSGVSAISMPLKIDVSDLVSRHQVEIWRYLRFLGCDAQAAEDLAQDTFVAVLRKPIADRGPSASASYLRSVARNLLLKSLRGSAQSTGKSVEVEFEEAEASWQRFRREGLRGEDGGDGYVEALRSCVQELQGKKSTIVDLIHRKGLSLQAAAEAMGLTVNGVRTLLQRMRQALRSCVARRMRQ